jgi:hypothetical protein
MPGLKIGEGKDWSFMHGAWTDGPDGELIPPDGYDVEYLAVRSDEAYGDFTARFRFKFRWTFGAARFMFRVQDSRRFYALDVPWCGQQNRARHFWAGMVIADGTPLQRYLNFAMVPGLCAKHESWYEARVEAKGSRLRAWIEDILVADVVDDTYATGRLGLGGITALSCETPHFSDLEVDGATAVPSDWPGLVPPPQHWISPCPVIDPDTCQSYASLFNGGSGKLLLCLGIGSPNWGGIKRSVYLRSSDAGRTWAAPEPATLPMGLGGTHFVRQDGTWVCVYPNEAPHGIARAWNFYTYESVDEGRFWTGPNEFTIGGKLPEGWSAPGPSTIVRMHDGSLLLVLDAFWEKPAGLGPEFLTVGTSFAVRSEDDGRTWSTPVRCDSSNKQPGEPVPAGTFEAALAGTGGETRFAEVREDVVIGICRPGKDPYMWKRQSNDGGRTWEPSAIGPFPGYCPSLTATANGAVVATTRFPHFAAHLSRDGGRTWDPPVIVEYSQWANQAAVLAEPDVVVVTHMGHCMQPGQADSRITRLKITPEGLVLDH